MEPSPVSVRGDTGLSGPSFGSLIIRLWLDTASPSSALGGVLIAFSGWYWPPEDMLLVTVGTIDVFGCKMLKEMHLLRSETSLALYGALRPIANLFQESHKFSTMIDPSTIGKHCAIEKVITQCSTILQSVIGNVQVVDRLRVRAPD